MENNIVFHNNKYLRYKDSNIGFLIHSLSYWLSINDNIRVYKDGDNWTIIWLDNYIKRFLSGCEKIWIDIKYSEDEINKIIINIIKLNKNLESPYIRLLWYFWNSIDPFNTTWSSMFSIWIVDLNLNTNDKSLTISDIKRKEIDTNSLKISRNYAQNYIDNLKYIKEWYDNVIITDNNNNLLETLNHNIFLVIDKTVITPALWNIVPWIIRGLIIGICKELKINIQEREINKKELEICEEVFISSTAFWIIKVKNINNINYKIFPTTDKIIKYINNELKLKNKIWKIVVTKIKI